MNAPIVRRVATAVCLVLTATLAPIRGASAASAPIQVRLGPGSALWLAGTSTLHDFESRTAETVVTMTRDGAAPEPRDAAGLAALMRALAVRDVEVTVPVLTLRSEKSGLDKNLWKTLKAGEYPNIVFHLDRYSLPDSGAAGDTIAVKAEGSLTVVGVSRPATLLLRAYPGDGGLWVEGRYALRMTEFGIKPPKMMLGTLRVGDRITVGYKLLLATRDGDDPPSVNGGTAQERSR